MFVVLCDHTSRLPKYFSSFYFNVLPHFCNTWKVATHHDHRFLFPYLHETPNIHPRDCSASFQLVRPSDVILGKSSYCLVLEVLCEDSRLTLLALQRRGWCKLCTRLQNKPTIVGSSKKSYCTQNCIWLPTVLVLKWGMIMCSNSSRIFF